MKAPQVLIIGAGVIGAACAYFLSRRGMRVVILEREAIAAGASGACDGHVTLQTKAPGLHTELALRSLELYRSLPDCFGLHAELRTCGSLLAACSEDELIALARLARSRQEAGIDVRFLDGQEARVQEPALTPGVRGACWCPTDMGAHPWQITRWFAAAAQEAGADIQRGAQVFGIEAESDGARVQMADRALSAPWVVVAAGAWTSQIAGLEALPVRPRRGEILVTERLPRLLNGIVLAAAYLREKFSTVARTAASPVMEQRADGTLLIGGTREFAGFDRRVTLQGLTGLARTALELVPALATAHLIRAFAGLRPWSPDGLPLVGRVGGVPQVIVAAGHEGDGITLAPVTAQLVTELICEGREPDPRLSPGRFGDRAEIQRGE